MKGKRKFIGRIVSFLTVFALTIPTAAQLSVSAEETEKYPYSLFGRNGITMTATSNMCINGAVHTNKEAEVSASNKNINGKLTTGNDIEKRVKHVYADTKIYESYFTENCDLYEEEYVYSELNIHINNPLFCYNNITLNGNVSLNSNLGTYMNLNVTGEVKNANTSVVYSKYGNITIENDSTANINGLIYAPLGTVTINSPNVTINGVIIADKVVINSSNVNINYNDNIARFIGTVSEAYDFSGLEYLPEEWLGDTDEDELFDIYEKVIDTDPLDVDTDDDYLPDGYEVLTLNTDPLEVDTDENGISDADEDFDTDNLNNLGEYQNGTQPYNPDTDEDGFLDGDEVNKYKTEPLNPDTDEDGLLDGEESYDGSIYAKYKVYFDPVNPDTDGDGILDGDEVFGQKKQQTVETHDEAITEIIVDMDTNGNLERNLTIESMYNIDIMSTEVYALIGEPFNFETPTSFNSAKITFKVDKTKLGDTKFDNLLILWYNEEEQIFEEMETLHDEANSTVSTTTTHFSQYMIVDSEKWHKQWNKSFEKLREMWIAGTSYYKSLNTIIVVDCSWKMAGKDNINYRSIELGYNGVTTDNYSNIRDCIDSGYNTEYYYEKYGRRQCMRTSICENIINNMNSGDRIALMMYDGNGVQYNTGLTSSYGSLMSMVQKVNNSGGALYLNDAVSTALSYVTTDIENMYRIIVITNGNVSCNEDDLASYNYDNVSLNIVSLGGGNLDYIENEDINVYYGYPSSALTSASGYYDETLPQFMAVDSDEDGIPDIVERFGLKPDGTPINSDPESVDTDGDGLLDNEEILYSPTGWTRDINKGQYDGTVRIVSDPTLVDTDGDEFPDNYIESEMSTKKYYPYSDPNPLTSDVTETALKNDFFSVDYEYKVPNDINKDHNWSEKKNNNNNASYGGYQGWLGSYGYTSDDKTFCLSTATGSDIHSYGCGIIAVADMFLYMALSNNKYNPTYMPEYNTPIDFGNDYNHIDFDTYVKYINTISNSFSLYRWPINGIPAVMPLDISSLLKSMETLNSCNNMGLSISWEHDTDKKQLAAKMKEMINNDIPVVFSNCVVIADGLQLYSFGNHTYHKYGTPITGHYMVATGVVEYSDDVEKLIKIKTMVRIATYGKELYMNFNEYNPTLIDTNIMYIQK